jgi:serine/threonine-protein kinase PknK
MRVEASVFRSVVECWADRTAGVDELVFESLSRPDTLPPWIVAVAADVVTFLEMHRFNFDGVRRWQRWAEPYHHRTSGPFTLVYGHCLIGIAANEQLELTEADCCFREALQVAKRCGGIHSHAMRLACALLGELLYERGEVDEAERLLDESYQLGAAGGPVEFMITRHVIGARIKALRGDRDTAAARLDDGARVAATLGLPRLRAYVDNERTRLGLPMAARLGQVEGTDALPDGGLGEITAQFRDETEILGLLADQPGLACERAQAWVQRLQPQGRPRALLNANRLLVATLSAAGSTEEAKHLLTELAAQCAELGMVRYLLDGGPWVVAMLAELRDDLRSGRWGPTWREVPPTFLDNVASGSDSLSPGAAAPPGGS